MPAPTSRCPLLRTPSELRGAWHLQVLVLLLLLLFVQWGQPAGHSQLGAASSLRAPPCPFSLTSSHPHRAAPEAIVKAQLAALQQGDVFNASCFSSWRGGMKGHVASRRTGAR